MIQGSRSCSFPFSDNTHSIQKRRKQTEGTTGDIPEGGLLCVLGSNRGHIVHPGRQFWKKPARRLEHSFTFGSLVECVCFRRVLFGMPSERIPNKSKTKVWSNEKKETKETTALDIGMTFEPFSHTTRKREETTMRCIRLVSAPCPAIIFDDIRSDREYKIVVEPSALGWCFIYGADKLILRSKGTCNRRKCRQDQNVMHILLGRSHGSR